VVLEARATTELPSAGDVLRIGFVAAGQLAAIAAWAAFTAWMLINLLRWLG
jgi:hypothetical protein